MIDFDIYSYFYDLVKQIPEGMITTYKSLANALGDVIAARAVGQMLAENPQPIIIPCHRVVKSDGTIGGFTHLEGINKKIELLKNEGIKITNGKIENFENLIFNGFKTDYPLKRIREKEKQLINNISNLDMEFEKIVAIDASYQGRKIFLSFVYIDEKLNILGIRNFKDVVNFPYIPTYFSYREGNAILKHYAGKDLLLLDGNGMIHPRGIGLATYVGIFANVPSIGIAKSHLYGILKNNMVFSGEKQIGWVIQNKYVSPGNNISLKKTYETIKKLFEYGDPIKFAHNFSNKFKELELQQQ